MPNSEPSLATLLLIEVSAKTFRSATKTQSTESTSAANTPAPFNLLAGKLADASAAHNKDVDPVSCYLDHICNLGNSLY